jgi:nucleotide-binding universal stress UspA family protein
MTGSSWKSGPPKIILLATDLSSRCDRALDRAAQLAMQWKSRLVVLTVLDPKEGRSRLEMGTWPSQEQRKDRADTALRQIRRDLSIAIPNLEALPEIEIRIEEGDAASKIDEAARMMGAGLVVAGVARHETLGRTLLGTTVQRLVRQTPVPVLVVKSRARPYRDILVATDFSVSSRHALDAAFSFFPDATKTLFHAFEVPFPELLDKGNARDEFRALEQKACNAFLVESELRKEQCQELRIVIEHGAPAARLRSHMIENGIDIVVMGTHGRSAAFDAVMGSTANLFLDCAPGDVLLVREPRSLRISDILKVTPQDFENA